MGEIIRYNEEYRSIEIFIYRMQSINNRGK